MVIFKSGTSDAENLIANVQEVFRIVLFITFGTPTGIVTRNISESRKLKHFATNANNTDNYKFNFAPGVPNINKFLLAHENFLGAFHND
ncbi:MAG: hypothetical protein WKF71_04035 [Pyrinomonadaceae bacterium]